MITSINNTYVYVNNKPHQNQAIHNNCINHMTIMYLHLIGQHHGKQPLIGPFVLGYIMNGFKSYDL